MGSFSWLRADDCRGYDDIYRNIYFKCPFKFLIPTEFGGGFIADNYRDYGYLGEPTEKQKEINKKDGYNHIHGRYDAYELLAMWNDEEEVEYYDVKTDTTVTDTIHNICLKYFGIDTTLNRMKEIDEYTNIIRGFGIDIGCYDEQINRLKYPLKFVHSDFEGSYEDCESPSYGDHDQGFYGVHWDGTYDGDEEDDFDYDEWEDDEEDWDDEYETEDLDDEE